MMRKRLRIFAVILSTIIVCGLAKNTAAQYYDSSYALVIGIDIYPSLQWPNLRYAVKDAKSMAKFLRQQGFKVTTLYDAQATGTNIIAKMQNHLARQVAKNDRILVFFAGHGYTETLGGGDFGYIVPYDGTSSSASYISMETLRTQSLKMGNAKHQLFIMDACYGGLLGLRSGAIPATIPNYLDEITKRRARQVLMAGGKDQQVVDNGPGQHSVFTGELLKALEEGKADLNRDGYITFSELAAYIVPAASNAYQTPSVAQLPRHQLGEFVFRSPQRRPRTHVIVAYVPDNAVTRGSITELPFFMTRLVSAQDLRDKNQWDLDVMRNEIYARHGRRFKRKDLQDYFNDPPWYSPQYDPKEFPVSLLTKTQQENAKFIRDYQRKHENLQ